MLKSFFHTGFIVKDLEAAVEFYSDVLGLTLTMRTERTGEFPTTLLGFPGHPHQRRVLRHGRRPPAGADSVHQPRGRLRRL